MYSRTTGRDSSRSGSGTKRSAARRTPSRIGISTFLMRLTPLDGPEDSVGTAAIFPRRLGDPGSSPSSGTHSPVRRAVLPLYALLLLETMVWIAIVPLAPTFAERLSLSPVETGALLASASFATVVVAFPAGLLLSGPGASLERPQRPLLGTLRAVRRDEFVLGGLALLMLLGFVSGGVNLLVPLHLRANGVSAGAIGLVFSAASGLFTVVSAVVARLGERAVSLKTGGVSALLLGLSILLLVASGSTAAAVAFVLLRAPFWAVMDTIVYPLGAAGAHR